MSCFTIKFQLLQAGFYENVEIEITKIYTYFKFKSRTIFFINTVCFKAKRKENDAFEEVLELAKNDDPAFLARFKEVYPEFYDKITSTYPDLTISQLRFCAMLKLNFSVKEIAHYHHPTNRGVQTRQTT